MTATVRYIYRNELRIEFDVPFGSQYHSKYRELQDDLEGVHGVETAVVSRYSAQVTLAPHIATAPDVAKGLCDVLAAYGETYADLHLIADLDRHYRGL